MDSLAYYAFKVVLSAVLITLISELAERSTFAGAVLASIPFVSVLAFVWLYLETGDGAQVADLAANIFWLVIPSLVLFVLLPVLLRRGMSFWVSLLIAMGATSITYVLVIRGLGALGIEM